MLYGIQDRINKAIADFGFSTATIDIYKGAARDLFSVPFVQVMEISKGLIFTTGQDDYTPSRPMHFVEGEVVIDAKEKSIQVIREGKVEAVIRPATLEEENIILDYVGFSTPEDIARMAAHVKQFEAACRDSEKFL